MLEVIPTIRQVVNQEPCMRKLRKTKTEKETVVSELAMRARRDRDAIRGYYEQLSRYYPLRKGVPWGCPGLLSAGEQGVFNALTTFHLPAFLSVVKDLERHPNLRQPPEETTSEASTPESQ
jgi:hypothetical protein